MATTHPREHTLLHAAELLRRGHLSAHHLVLSCLERVEARQSEIRAWVTIDPDQALETARRMDAEAAEKRWRGPLHGIPVGIKDIIDVKGMETKAGTEAHPARIAAKDATCVARLREAGAIILGKLTTTPFAYRDPSDTRNPWNPSFSAGGSSSGSGAAVADRMCMAALGTQTGGSVLRPASYNGVVGWKPGYGTIPTTGLIPLAWQLDHVGTLTRSVEDAHLLWEVLRQDGGPWQSTAERMAPSLRARAPRRIWRIRDFFETEAQPEVLVAVEQACLKLEQNGVEIVEKALPEGIAEYESTYLTIQNAEAAAYHQANFQENQHLYPDSIQEVVEAGLLISAVDYVRARKEREHLRGVMAQALADVDAAIMPTTPTAPPGPSSTGSPRFNTPWSLCGLPAISLPTGFHENGLPAAVQMITSPGREEALLQVAGWGESRFGFRGAPK